MKHFLALTVIGASISYLASTKISFQEMIVGNELLVKKDVSSKSEAINVLEEHYNKDVNTKTVKFNYETRELNYEFVDGSDQDTVEYSYDVNGEFPQEYYDLKDLRYSKGLSKDELNTVEKVLNSFETGVVLSERYYEHANEIVENKMNNDEVSTDAWYHRWVEYDTKNLDQYGIKWLDNLHQGYESKQKRKSDYDWRSTGYKTCSYTPKFDYRSDYRYTTGSKCGGNFFKKKYWRIQQKKDWNYEYRTVYRSRKDAELDSGTVEGEESSWYMKYVGWLRKNYVNSIEVTKQQLYNYNENVTQYAYFNSNDEGHELSNKLTVHTRGKLDIHYKSCVSGSYNSNIGNKCSIKSFFNRGYYINKSLKALNSDEILDFGDYTRRLFIHMSNFGNSTETELKYLQDNIPNYLAYYLVMRNNFEYDAEIVMFDLILLKNILNSFKSIKTSSSQIPRQKEIGAISGEYFNYKLRMKEITVESINIFFKILELTGMPDVDENLDRIMIYYRYGYMDVVTDVLIDNFHKKSAENIDNLEMLYFIPLFNVILEVDLLETYSQIVETLSVFTDYTRAVNYECKRYGGKCVNV